MRVLFSNEPLAYREAMAAVVETLRPLVVVSVSDPSDLDADVSRLRPELVVCSDITDSIRVCVPAWVSLYPGGESSVSCSIEGRERHQQGIDLAGLLVLVDEVAAHVQALSQVEASTGTSEPVI